MVSFKFHEKNYWESSKLANSKILCHFDQFGRPRDPWQPCRNFGFGKTPKWPWQHVFFGTYGRFLKILWDIRWDCTLELIPFKSRKICPLDCSGKFFSIFTRFIYNFFKWFRQLTKIAVTSVTFRRLEMTRDCRIDQNGTVTPSRENHAHFISCKPPHKTTPESTLGLHFVSFKLQHQLLRNLKFYQLHFIWPPL